MARLELSGKIEFIGDVVTVGISASNEKGTKKQILMLAIPPRKDEWTNEEYGETEFWELSAMGDRIGKLNLSDAMIGKQATIRIYLNSKTVPKEGGGYFYPINANIASIELK